MKTVFVLIFALSLIACNDPTARGMGNGSQNKWHITCYDSGKEIVNGDAVWFRTSSGGFGFRIGDTNYETSPAMSCIASLLQETK